MSAPGQLRAQAARVLAQVLAGRSLKAVLGPAEARVGAVRDRALLHAIVLAGVRGTLRYRALLALLLASSHGLLKWVSVQSHSNYLQLMLEQWRYVLISLMIYGLVFFYYILVLRSSPVSTLYPVYTGLSVLFVLLVGRFVFHEVVSVYQIAGAALILAGIVLMGRTA